MDATPQESLDGAASPVAALCRSWLAGLDDPESWGLAITRVSADRLEDTPFSEGTLASPMVELQKTLGEGPALSVLAERGPVFVADLRDSCHGRTWVAFASEAQQAGVHSYYALPLQIGSVILGVLTAHAMSPPPHSGGDLAGLLALADAVALALLKLGADDLDAGHDGVALLGTNSAVIHQASGMVMVQTRGTIQQALLTLQSYAYGQGLPLLQVAGDVVSRRIRFDHLRGTHSSPDGGY
jgi:hypothetical protein